jgi:hypothetical protein
MYREKHTETLTSTVQSMQISQEMDTVQVLFELKRHGVLRMQTRMRMS